MKHIAISLAVLMLMWGGDAHAETWSCSYIADGKPKVIVYKITGSKWSVHNQSITDSLLNWHVPNFGEVLHNDKELFIGVELEVPVRSLFVYIIDKKKRVFKQANVPVGGKNTVNTGPCSQTD